MTCCRRFGLYSKLKVEPKNADGCVMLAGGPRFQEDPNTWDTFIRDDGARFGFALTFREEKHSLKLLTYSYTFCFPPALPPPIAPLRWDLDLSGPHGDDGLRSHLHLATEVRVPAPQWKAG